MSALNTNACNSTRMRQAKRTSSPTVSLSHETSPSGEPPSTPSPRGRPASRYPSSLALGEPGRVPLHRRGTSKTYERLEDLLREAGYKETRIFTPEAERAEEGRRGSVRGGVDAVVGFLAGWIPGAGKGEDSPSEDAVVAGNSEIGEPVAEENQSWTPPSPLGHRSSRTDYSHNKGKLLISSSPSSTTLASLHSYRSAHSSGRTASHMGTDAPPRVIQTTSQSLRPRASASDTLRTYAQVSAARGYLRHMVSAPNIPRQRLPLARDSSADRRSVCLDERAPPALPARWFESISKAVLGSDTGRPHMGGPVPSSSRDERARSSKFTLSDRTNHPAVGRASGLPRGLSAYLQRSETAPGAVSTAQVMCRSAPASRSSSRVRGRTSFGSFRDPPHSSKRRQGKGGVPILASTHIENELWGLQWVDRGRLLVPRAGAESVIENREDEEEEEDDDDDDEGELDLARILVPPKRQYSIQSLRKHLHTGQRPPSRGGVRDDEDDDIVGGHWRTRRGSMDEGQHAYAWAALGAPGFERPAKRRTGIPRGWTGLGRRS